MICIAAVLISFLLVPLDTAPIEFKNGFEGGNADEWGPYFGGDMILSPEQLAQLKSGIRGNSYRWPKGRIPYTIDPRFNSRDRRVINDGFHLIQSKTCIRFVQRSNERDYISIKRGGPGSGCYATVGHQGGKQDVNLQTGNPGCLERGIVAHELIHAIGFFHEQSRPDRDDYVAVHWDNIQNGMRRNFDKYSTTKVGTYGVPYDYGSIMHYSSKAFSTNGRETITPKKSGVSSSVLGQRRALSSKDAQKINAMYKGLC